MILLNNSNNNLNITYTQLYCNRDAFTVFLHCLLKANPKQESYSIDGIEIKRGQLLTSTREIVMELHLKYSQNSMRRVCAALTYLKKNGYIHNLRLKSKGKTAFITIEDYDKWVID